MGNSPITASDPFPLLAPPEYLCGWRFRLRRLRLLAHVLRLARRVYPSWKETAFALRGLRDMIRENDRIRHITRGVLHEGKLFSILSYPGGPSPAQDVFLKNELHRIRPIPGHESGLLLLLLAITKKCSLQCAHCFEWDNLNGRESLSVNDVLTIIRKFQVCGVAQIELSGGEPLNRYEDLLNILRQSDHSKTDFWVLTSGYRLTAERALALKTAGLVGVSVSLDHWDPAEHDRFRGLEGSFAWVEQAVYHARKAGLLVGLSLTPVKDFCTPEHLFRYAELAKMWGVPFLRILEPRAVGHFAGQPVELESSQRAVLEEFTRTIQHNPRYRNHPIIDYYGTYQRAVGCSGAGSRYLYVDTDGDLHACPFCQNKCGSAVNESITDGIQKMQMACGCHAFESV